MGNCCAQEDVGMSMSSKNRGAVGANIESISDETLSLMSSADSLKQRLILSFELKDLPNMDKKSKTDSFCVLFFLKPGAPG